MQLMSWIVARLGGRFSLLFEPYRRRVMHSALGRFLDQPLDLMVGLVEPDGTERVLPFTTRGTPLFNPEQFERLNSITFRGYSPRYRLRFEFNVHSVFYPQDERLCLLPVFFLEMRVHPVERVRWIEPAGSTPTRVNLFLRLDRPGTRLSAVSGGGDAGGRIDLAYRASLTPRHDPVGDETALAAMGENVWSDPVEQQPAHSVEVRERILSLNTAQECRADEDGKGLSLELPVTETGSGIKWRLIWGAYCGEPVLEHVQRRTPGRFRYTRHWSSLDEVMDEAVARRDDYLGHSRRLEKLAEQAALRQTERHLIDQSLQGFLANTFWCDFDAASGTPAGPSDGTSPDGTVGGDSSEWFSVWEGSRFLHSPLDVTYNASPFYLSFWPRLLALKFDEWAQHARPHEPSGGAYMQRDLGRGTRVGWPGSPMELPVELTSCFLLMVQAHAHWTGDLEPAKAHAALVERLARYLLWVDRQRTGFPAEGAATAILDAGPVMRMARKPTYLAVKRLAALDAAADLLSHVGGDEALAQRCEEAVEKGTPKIESASWLGDHYALCGELGEGVGASWRDDAVLSDRVPGADAYSIYTANGLLLPLLSNQPRLLDSQRLLTDVLSATRETLGPYGCGHTSDDLDSIWVSQNLWRDLVARYLGVRSLTWTPAYWDLQVMSNTHQQSLGACDTYIGNNHSFYPRLVCSLGLLVAYPRLVIDRLAAGGTRISVDPDRHFPQRWPLFPLADWKAGKVPVCVVDAQGRVKIEGESDPIIVRGEAAVSGVIG